MSGVEDSKFLLSKIVLSKFVVVPRFVEFNFVVSRAIEIRVELSGVRMEVFGIRVKVSWNLMSRVEDSGLLLKILFSVVVPRFVEFTFAVSRDVEIRFEVSGIGIELSGIGVEVNWDLMSRVEESSLLSKMILSRLLVMGEVGFGFVVSRIKETGVEVSVSGLGQSEIGMCWVVDS